MVSEIAYQTYIQYENHIFFGKPSRIWDNFSNEEITIAFADDYALRCTVSEFMQDEWLCAYWARYERCVIAFNFLALAPYMTLSDFATFIETEIDQKMTHIEVCYRIDN